MGHEPALVLQYNSKDLSFDDWLDDKLLGGCVPLKYRNEYWFARKDIISCLVEWFMGYCDDGPAERQAAFEHVRALARDHY